MGGIKLTIDDSVSNKERQDQIAGEIEVFSSLFAEQTLTVFTIMPKERVSNQSKGKIEFLHLLIICRQKSHRSKQEDPLVFPQFKEVENNQKQTVVPIKYKLFIIILNIKQSVINSASSQQQQLNELMQFSQLNHQRLFLYLQEYLDVKQSKQFTCKLLYQESLNAGIDDLKLLEKLTICRQRNQNQEISQIITICCQKILPIQIIDFELIQIYKQAIIEKLAAESGNIPTGNPKEDFNIKDRIINISPQLQKDFIQLIQTQIVNEFERFRHFYQDSVKASLDSLIEFYNLINHIIHLQQNQLEMLKKILTIQDRFVFKSYQIFSFKIIQYQIQVKEKQLIVNTLIDQDFLRNCNNSLQILNYLQNNTYFKNLAIILNKLNIRKIIIIIFDTCRQKFKQIQYRKYAQQPYDKIIDVLDVLEQSLENNHYQLGFFNQQWINILINIQFISFQDKDQKPIFLQYLYYIIQKYLFAIFKMIDFKAEAILNKQIHINQGGDGNINNNNVMSLQTFILLMQTQAQIQLGIKKSMSFSYDVPLHVLKFDEDHHYLMVEPFQVVLAIHQELQSTIFQILGKADGLDKCSLKNKIQLLLKMSLQTQRPFLQLGLNQIIQPFYFNSKIQSIRKIMLNYKNNHKKFVTLNDDSTCVISTRDDDNSSVCSEIYLDFDADLNQEYSFIGVLITIKNSDQSVSASTAFLTNNHTVLTCIHAFENEKRDFVTSEVIFVPNCVKSLKTFRYSAEISKKDVVTTNTDPNFSYKTVGRQLAMFSLSKEAIRVGISIPKCASYEQMAGKRVFIVGYPLSVISYSFRRQSTVEEEHATINRQRYEGDYVNIDPTFNVIEHNLPTQAGVSGAPIMGRREDNQNEIIIIGIHTHGAKLRNFYNMGLLFTKEIVEKIEGFMRENEEKYLNSEDELSSISFEGEEKSKSSPSEVSTNCHKQSAQ